MALLFTVVVTLAFGVGLGWFLWGRQRPATSTAALRQDQTSTIHLWDSHGSLNALNRCAYERDSDGLDNDPIYLVAAHLQSLAALGKTQGFARRAQIDQWLTALLELHQYLHPAPAMPTHGLQAPAALEQLQLGPLGEALVRMLHQCGPVKAVEIEVLAPDGTHAPAGEPLRVQVHVTPASPALALVVDTVECIGIFTPPLQSH